MSLEGAIRGSISDTAAILGIEGRGVVREGAYGDINGIDFDNLAMELPEYTRDLPACVGRFVQRGRGLSKSSSMVKCSCKGPSSTANSLGRWQECYVVRLTNPASETVGPIRRVTRWVVGAALVAARIVDAVWAS